MTEEGGGGVNASNRQAFKYCTHILPILKFLKKTPAL